MKKMLKAASLGLVTAVLIGSINLTFGIVGIPDSSSDETQTQENQNTESSVGVVSSGIDDSPIKIIDPNETLEDEESDVNKSNKSLVETLQDSMSEDPNGSLYTEKYAYYKVGKLSEKPEVKAPSVILMDANSGYVLYNKSGSENRYPASMTKVMTALIAIENGNLDDTITITEDMLSILPNDASVAGLSVGDTITLNDALHGLLMASGADCAMAIAKHIGGDGGVEQFVAMMNTKAEQLGCAFTNFVNPHGLHDTNHYTTSYDMAKIMNEAIKYDDFVTLIGDKTYTIKGDVKNEIALENRSALLASGNENYYEYAKGSKTGHTDEAGYTLVSFAEYNNETLICVVMGEESFGDSYSDTKKLFEWGYKKTQVINPVPDEYSIENVLSESMSADKLDRIKVLSLKYMPDYGLLTNTAINKDAIKNFFVMDEDMETGILGYVYVSYYDKILIGKTPILYEIDDENYKEYMKYYDGTTENNGDSVIQTGTETENPSVGDEYNPIVEEVDPIYDDIGNDTDEKPSFIPEDMDLLSVIQNGISIYLLTLVVMCMIAYIIILSKRR